MKWQIGDVTITRIVELMSGSIGRYILPDATPKEMQKLNWISPFVDENRNLLVSFHALMIQTNDRLMIVDTCIGNDKSRNYSNWNHLQANFLNDFQDCGFDNAKVDTVLCTHMHVDHVGWNTYERHGKWVATFENAKYLFSEK